MGGSTGGSSSAASARNLGGSSFAVGGTAASGGKSSAGGASAETGGTNVTGGSGGMSSTGGTKATGGVTSSAKSGIGGTEATGGVSSSAKSATGGTEAAGGVTSSAKSSTGGVGVGGTVAEGGKTGAGGTAMGGTMGAGGTTGTIAKPNFDWVGVVGSGQSLSVGFTPANTAMGKAYYNNLMLQQGATSFPGTISGGTGGNPGVPVPGSSDKPWDSTMSDLKAVPLVEPVRAVGSGYPRPYPINIYGETHHSAMAREITHFVQSTDASADYITAHTVVGESGMGITALIKQTGSDITDVGRAYAATIFEAGAFSRIAKAAGKTYGVGVVVMTHGETDAMPYNADYGKQLIQLLADYNADISAITGQTYKIPMYINQQHGCPNNSICKGSTSGKGARADVNNIEWQLGVTNKDDFVCTGPKYQYQANSNGDGLHISVQGAEMLGEKTAQVFYQRAILGNDWQPLMPIGVEVTNSTVVTVHFHVPVPPLVWDTTFDAPAITEWKNGKGFELRSDTANITIASVALSGNDVQITASSALPTSGLHVGYAISNQGVQLSNHSKAVRWGMLRDSDTFAGVTTTLANQNYSVSFDIPAPWSPSQLPPFN